MTKVSGLAAAAAALTTHEIGVNEGGTSKKLTVAQLMALLPQGTLGQALVTANQTSITTTVDVTGLTKAVTVGAGRRIKISVQLSGQSTVAGDNFAVTINEGATVLDQVLVSLSTANLQVPFVLFTILTPTTGAHTYKVTIGRVAGTGTLTMVAGTGATNPIAKLLIEDIGT